MEAVNRADQDGRVAHTVTLDRDTLNDAHLDILGALRAREIRLPGTLPPPAAGGPDPKALLRLAERTGARFTRTGPDPWLDPRRLAAMLRPWKVGMTLEGWTLEAVTADEGPPQRARLSFRRQEGGAVDLLLARPDREAASRGAPKRYDTAFERPREGDAAPEEALPPLLRLVTGALERGKRVLRARGAPRRGGRSTG